METNVGFQDFSGTESLDIDGEEEEDEEIEEGNEEDSINIAVAKRWYDGLINKDICITNEIYSLCEIDFDQQELWQLVRKVHATLEPQPLQRKMENLMLLLRKLEDHSLVFSKVL